MDKSQKPELKTKSVKDGRFTLFLMIGCAFLLVYVVQIMHWDKSELMATKGYVLQFDDYSLSIIAEDEQEKEFISKIPWDLSPLFFRKIPINIADKGALMCHKRGWT